MDLIERYLAAVGRQLPSKQAADIKAELRDVLLSRVEEQEAALGRPLDRAELEALLIDFGNPLVVAGRYRKTQHLIGPEVFPFWWAAVKIALSIILGVYLVLVIVAAIAGKNQAEFKRTVPDIWYVSVYIFGMITLVCAFVERVGKTQILAKWKPRDLPPATGKTRSRFELAAEIATNVVFILWWVDLIHFRDIIGDPGFLTVNLAPVWTVWKWPIVAYSSLEIAIDLFTMAQSGRVWVNGIASIVRYLVGIGILSQVVQAGHWLVVSGPQPPHAMSLLQTNFDLGMKVVIGGAIVLMALRIAQEAWRLRWIYQATAIELRLA